jgi:hypothetical protein
VNLRIVASAFAGVLIIIVGAAEKYMSFQRTTDEAFVMLVRRAKRGLVVTGRR